MPHVAHVNMLQILSIGFYYSFVFLLYFYAVKIGNISVVGPISEGFALITAFLGIIFLHESFGLFKFVGMIVLFLGVILVGFQLHSSQKANPFKGVTQALLATLGMGVYFFWVGIAARENGWFWTALLMRVAIAATTYLLLIIRKEQATIFQKVPWKLFMAAAAFDVAGFSLYNFAVTKFEVSYVTLVTTAQSLIIVVLSYLFLKKKLHRYQFVGVVLIILGLISLQLH